MRRLEPEDERLKKPARQEAEPAQDAVAARGEADANLAALQRSLGNAAVGRLFGRGSAEGRGRTEAEAEADSVEPGRDVLQELEGAGPGEPLPQDLRAELAPSSGGTLDGVRLHTDERAAGLADRLDAVAFTRGRDIFFARGAFDSASPAGRETLAHEAAHVAQQQAGSVPAGAIQRQRRRRAHATEVTFTPEEVAEETIEVERAEIGQGSTPQQFIDFQLGRLRDAIGLYWSNYRDGLQNFETTMALAADQEQETSYLSTTFKTVGKFLLDEAIDAVGEVSGPVGKALSLAKDLAEAWVEERDRAEGAGGEVQIRSYIVDLRTGIGQLQGRMQTEVNNQREGALQEFGWSSRAPSEGGDTLIGESAVTGLGATFLNGLRHRVDLFEHAIPDTARFQQKFAENFAGPHSRSGAWEGTGGLYISMDVTREQAGIAILTQIQDIDSTWELVSTAPNPGRIAQNLQDSLRAQGKKPYESTLPKMIHLRLNGIDGYIYVQGTDLRRYEARSNYDLPPFEEAWGDILVMQRIQRIDRIHGSSG